MKDGCWFSRREGGVGRGQVRDAFPVVAVASDQAGLNALRATEVLEAVATLRTAARRWSADWAAAEDLLQDTVERAFRTLDTYRPGTSARAWMRTIMFRLAVDHSRRARQEQRLRRAFATQSVGTVEAQETGPELEPPEPSPAELRAAAKLLREPFRTTFDLWAVKGLSYQEISLRLSVPVGTVATRLLRARRALAASFRPAQTEPRSPRRGPRFRCAGRPELQAPAAADAGV